MFFIDYWYFHILIDILDFYTSRFLSKKKINQNFLQSRILSLIKLHKYKMSLTPKGDKWQVHIHTAPEIDILPLPDIVTSSHHIVSVIRISCRSQVAMHISKECNSNLSKNTLHYTLEYHIERGAFMDRRLYIRYFLELTNLLCK